jgi:MFS family permease
MTTTPHRVPHGARAFNHRNYRLFFAGQATSLVGTWMQQVAQSWLVLLLTGDVLWLGVIAAAQFIPILVLGLPAGVFADAWPKRPTLIVTQAMKMSLSIALAIIAIANVESFPLLVVIALGIGTANAFDMPVRQAFVVEMVGREDIGNAVALNSAMFNSARIIGPAVAGLTIGAVGVAAAFVIDAFSFLAVIGALLLMDERTLRTPAQIARPRSVHEVRTQLVEGLYYDRRTPLVLIAVIVIGLVSTVAINFSVIIPAYARDVLGGDATTYGFLMAASGVGSLIAAIWLAFGSGGQPRRIAFGAIGLGIGEVMLAASQLFPISMLIMVGVGFGSITMAASANTTMQLAVPDGLRGRVMSVYTTIFAGSTPIGGPIMAAIASFAGVAVSLAVGGVLAVVIGLAAFARLRRLGLDRPLAVTPPLAAPYTSGAPSTNAALRPPNPNEVLSTRS